MLIKISIVLFLIILSFNQSPAQSKVDLYLGLGIPEFINVGVRVRFDQFQIGAGAGSFPVEDETVYTIFGYANYHFAGKSKYSDLQVWYVRAGLDFLKDETRTTLNQYLYLDLRIGANINITSHLGLFIDGGLLIEVMHEKEKKHNSNGWNINIETPVLPCIGVGLFYRI